MKSNKKIEQLIFYFSRILMSFIFIFLFIFGVNIIKANLFPFKYLILIILILIGMMILFWFLLWKKHNFAFKIISSFGGLIVCIMSFIGILYLNNTFAFLKNLLSDEYESINYNVVVLKSMEYDNINDLEDEVLGLLNENSNNVIDSLSLDITFKDSISNDVGSLLDGLYNYSLKAIIIDNDVLAMLKEEKNDIDFENVTKVIYTFKVKTKISNENAENISINDAFAIYISGIDQYGNINTVRGRSDVNIIMIINPRNNKILLINTPRDYYVSLSGKQGLKDKLTHAGIYGIDLSINTLEDLYDMKIDYYLRVNFDTLIELVDVIDGIEVYSDQTFNSSFIKDWKIQKGVNYMDGKKALAYSRERYAYITGDRHRGQNQQDVINAIIKKTSKSRILLTKYNKIIDSLNGSFQTNIPTETIQSFIKFQLDKMPFWDIESINVSGSDSYEYTYSYGMRQKLYVMVPYEKDISSARIKINEVLNEK